MGQGIRSKWVAYVQGLLFFYAILFFVQCGKKTPPVPIVNFDPPPVSDFSYSIDNQQLTLTWQFAPGKLPETSVPDSFFVDRSKISVADGGCESCPPKFRKISESKRKKSGVYEYSETLETGFVYAFRVIPVSQTGKKGPPSNTITFTY